MKTSYQKSQSLQNVHEDERLRIVRGHVDGTINMHSLAQRYGVTKDTFMGYVNRWLIDEYTTNVTIICVRWGFNH
jgi:transposase-like protein